MAEPFQPGGCRTWYVEMRRHAFGLRPDHLHGFGGDGGGDGRGGLSRGMGWKDQGGSSGRARYLLCCSAFGGCDPIEDSSIGERLLMAHR
jgi:hypothetical protein